MSRITTSPTNNSITSTGASGTSSSAGTKGNDFRDVDLNQFLSLLITQMQNQDPLNPTSNSEFLQQVSQIREIGATNQLTESLSAMTTGSSLSTASNLIGREINAIDDAGKDVTGEVSKITVISDPRNQNNRQVRVHVGDQTVDMKNIREIRPAS
jgi:flagellar basal-body rod modification protein FlgD